MLVLANGMGMLFIKPFWYLCFYTGAGVAILALALVFARVPRAGRILAWVSLPPEILTFVTLLGNYNYIGQYAPALLDWFTVGSFLPPLLTGLAFWLSYRVQPRRPPGAPPPDGR